MTRALLALLLALPAQAQATRDRDEETLRRAAADVRTALLNEYILMSSVQAALIQLQWGLQGRKLAAQKAMAAEDCDRLSAKMKRFRDSAEVVDAQTNPLEPVIEELAKSKSVKKASEDLPKTVAGQIAEIQKIRADYSGDLSRSALIRASALAQKLQASLGTPRLLEAQEAVVALARDFLEDLRGTKARLQASLANPRKEAAKDLAQLNADAVDMATEVERLRLHFVLDNYHAAGARDLKDSPASGPDLRGQDEVSDPDMVGELKSADSANLDSALSRGSSDAALSAENAAMILESARRRLANAAAKEAKGSDREDALTLSVQMLKAKAELFRTKAASASLRVPKLSADDSITRRAGYRARDRQRDLAKAEANLSRLKSEPVLASAQAAALSALKDCLSELRNARLQFTQNQGRAAALDAAGAALVTELDEDLLALKSESRLLEVALKLARENQAQFDSSR